MPEIYKYILCDTSEGITEVTLNRPLVHNAFHYEMLSELKQAIDHATAQECDFLILKGAGPSFCAGADIRWFSNLREASDREVEHQLRAFADVLWALYNYPAVTIAVLHGSVMGGGLGLAAACDFVLGADDTRMAFREVRLGIVPALISVFIIQKTGAQRSKELMLTGNVFDGNDAKNAGLFSFVVQKRMLEQQLNSLLSGLRSGGRGARKEIKRMIGSADRQRVTYDKLEAGLAQLKSAILSEEAKEGFVAFHEKRAPVWSATEGNI